MFGFHVPPSQKLFQRRIDSFLKTVLEGCDDTEAIKDAKELVPIAQIVQDNLDILEGNYQDNLLPHIIEWFSRDFFTWFNTPGCEKCDAELCLGGCFSNIEGNMVERYKCNNTTCNYSYDFIRHNDPAILIRTRRGRCGEWANCFLLLLRALDFEARIVLDTTDHVWNEVWSESQQRWLHVDPCEGVIDAPLLYELGWGKKLEYCLAFGQYEVLDVTKRYSSHYDETKLRRTECNESWLVQYMDALTSELCKKLPDSDKARVLEHRSLDKRHLNEIPTSKRTLPEGVSLKGRKTGSLDWRISRGEFNPIIKNSYVIKVIKSNPPGQEAEPLFELLYNSIKNAYEGSTAETSSKGWSTLSYLSENLDYKYERDWKTSYVARYESCPAEKAGKLQWRFDLSNADHWSRLEIQINCEIYPATTVEMSLDYFSDDTENPRGSIKLSPNTINFLTPEQMVATPKFMDLQIQLAGGDPSDQVAWQKPQLFRQTRGKNDDKWSFTWRLH